ncbi:MAG: sulfite exporter TauE/SafE family protein [Proteobacteria bacterium]|nr:sulfite exporter TauE/SafE family protein [Pseudomonadota bacterium]
MTEIWPVATAALAAGFVGSAHCFGMCSGISGLFAVGANVRSIRSEIPKAIAYNAGRVLSYAFLGMVVALLGKTAVSSIPDLAAPVRLASGLLIVLVGLQLAFGWRILAPLETAGSTIWRRIAPAAKRLVPVETTTQAIGLGLIWGWLPCGLVYSVLLLAATTAEPAGGGLVMIAFGLGTMPAMIATGVSASKIAQFMSGKRLGAGLLIVVLGLATIAMPVMALGGSQDHAAHHVGHAMPADGGTADSRAKRPDTGYDCATLNRHD